MGLATMATNSTSSSARPVLVGQPELLGDEGAVARADRVEEGERDDLAREATPRLTWAPCWSMRAKRGAGESISGCSVDGPVRIGSALG